MSAPYRPLRLAVAAIALTVLAAPAWGQDTGEPPPVIVDPTAVPPDPPSAEPPAVVVDDTDPDEIQDPAEPDNEPIASLKGIRPALPDLTGIVRDAGWVKAAGKALFWDQRVGSDTVACASCHFRAGADPRITNQLNPGLLGGDSVFGATSGTGLTASGQVAGPNITLRPGDFPFRKLADPNNARSRVLYDTNDVVASAGTFAGAYVSSPSRLQQQRRLNSDRCEVGVHPVFNVGGNGTRKVEPRNSPSVINAVFYHRNFWDGRANNLFSGVGVFGRRDLRDPTARLVVRRPDGTLAVRTVRLDNASIASQAVGPVLSDFEMSCEGRAFADVGRKLLPQRALSLQKVDPTDSLLGPAGPVGDLVQGNLTGLGATYLQMVTRGFHRRFWSAPGRYSFTDTGELVPDPKGYTQVELNFPLFFGIAVGLYEAELVSDDSPFDRGALTEQERRGMDVFTGKGKCANCHDGPLFSKAAPVPRPGQQPKLVERMVMADGQTALYDNGFYNIGVRPAREDLGVGGEDAYGFPLSFSRQWALGRKRDSFTVDTCAFETPFPGGPCGPDIVPPGVDLRAEWLAVNGAFKTPTLRNIALTPPYFHNGGQATLEQVVDFYNRGGDFNSPFKAPDIVPLGLTAQEKADLVAFMKSLTDERVRCSKAPFDHPELLLPDGHRDTVRPDGRLADQMRLLRATGAAGYPSTRCPSNTGNLFDMARNINGFPIRAE